MLTKVNRIRQEARNIVSIELVNPDGNELPRFTAGSHVNVRLPDGNLRPYSICNDPREAGRYVLGVLLTDDSRGGSAYMHQLEVGDLVSVSEPKNLFAIRPAACPVVLIAAGIGITPILSMAHQLCVEGRPFTLHYAARSSEDAAFHDFIKASKFSSRSHFYFSSPSAYGRLDVRKLLEATSIESEFYICGPGRLIKEVEATFKHLGLEMRRVHIEHFLPPTVREEGDTNAGFYLASNKSNRRIYIAPDENVAQCMIRAGFDVSTSCEQGICGACLTNIVSGIPDHRDSFLTDEERASNKQFLPCCSRALTEELIVDA